MSGYVLHLPFVTISRGLMDLIGQCRKKVVQERRGTREHEDLSDKRDIVFRVVGNGNRGCLDKVDECNAIVPSL